MCLFRMPRFIAGNYYAATTLGSMAKRRIRARARIKELLNRQSGATPEPPAETESEEDEEQTEEDPACVQTFPTPSSITVVRNEMYDKTLGYYHVEVLKAVLTDKGKYVQRVDAQKIPSDYFHSVLAMNPLFSGYIVALHSEAIKHYVTIRYADGNCRLIDSLPGVVPLDIPGEELFRVRQDGHVYCSTTCRQPVAAILAVGGSPFVEYELLHDTWSANPPPIDRYRLVLGNILQHESCREIATFQKAFQRRRCQPDDQTRKHLKSMLLERVSDEWSIVVKKGDEQTIVKCRQIDDLLDTLCERQWIDTSRDFVLEQSGQLLTNNDGERITLGSKGPLNHFSIKVGEAITLKTVNACANHPQIGGFYQIDSSIQGTCVGTQQNAYSVRDDSGTMHVVYKGNVKRIQHIKR